MILLSVSKYFKFAIFSLLGILFFVTLESLENLFAQPQGHIYVLRGRR